VRFNEAIDQALAESIAFFTAEVDRVRKLFLGMLGHDMRTAPGHPDECFVPDVAERRSEGLGSGIGLTNCSARIKALLDDLVEFNRTKLGMGIDIAPTDVDLAACL
jgi:hypothetical protein